MTNFEIIDNGLINTMSQNATIVIHSICAMLGVLGVIGTVLGIIYIIKGNENPIAAVILCVLLFLVSVFTPFVIKEDNLIQTYKVKPTEYATIEDMFDFEMKYGIITKENDWYIVYEK